jgi:hypothetical protein
VPVHRDALANPFVLRFAPACSGPGRTGGCGSPRRPGIILGSGRLKSQVYHFAAKALLALI